jgi:dehydrogenase/reductase SDR family member 7B
MYKTNTTVAFFLLRLLLLLLGTPTCCIRATATASTITTAFIRGPPAVSSSNSNYPWRRSRTMTQLFNSGGGWWWSGSTNGGGGLHTATIQEFAGKNVLITGASSGLGRSLALQLAQYGGVHTLLLSARSVTTLQEVAQECYALHAVQASKAGGRHSCHHHHSLTIHILPADLADPESVQQLAQQALDYCRKSSSNNSSSNDTSNSNSNNNNTIHKTNTGRIDVLINNGGVSSRSRFVDTSIAIDQQILQINFLAGAALAKMLVQQHYPYVNDRSDSNNDSNDDNDGNNNDSNDGIPTTRSTLPTTPPDRTSRATRGRIIWISSIQGKIGIPNRSSYAASKFAVQGYCECIRSELYTDGILVHCISPGYIQTNLSRSALTGTGQRHGQLDITTAQGQSPHVVATTILNQVVVQRAMDFMVASGNWSATIAIWMQWWCPRCLQWLLVRRYQKSIGVSVMNTNTTTTTSTTNRIPPTTHNNDKMD